MRRVLVSYIGFFVALMSICNTYEVANNYEAAINTQNEMLVTKDAKIAELEKELSEVETVVNYTYVVEEPAYKAIFTNYYVGDGSSTKKTGSGLTTDNFVLNEDGFYTYNGYVVVATASWQGIWSDEPVLKDVKDVPYGYHVYHYGDTFKFVLNGKEYEAIVLDTCGKSYEEADKYQRIDVFTRGSVIGKREGIVYE